MKYIALIALLIVSCTKEATDTNKNTTETFKNVISGKWNLITDSSYSGAGISNHLTVYVGKSDDYFDFRTDGYVYTKEGTGYDTLSYQLLSYSEIIIETFGLKFNGVPDISQLTVTSDTLNISSPEDITPGGIFKRTIHLSR